MKRSPFYVFCSFLFIANTSFANEFKMIAKNVKTHTNVCDKNSSFYKKTGKECGIKKVRFETQNYSLKDGEDIYPYYGTAGYFGFEAKNWEELQKYGFVQSIRGCTYEVKENADGSLSKRIGETIMHLGKKRIYVFPEWSIDATTNDPLYYGPLEEDATLPGGRLSLHRWTPNLSIIDRKKTKDLYKMLELSNAERQKLSPSIFVIDTPSMAMMRDEKNRIFQNVSLEFNICLYQLNEIPLLIHNDDPMKGTPIVCHKWNSQFEFDFKKDKYVHLPNKGMDSFCATQEPLSPTEIYKRERAQQEAEQK